MRHNKAYKKLNRTTSHRKALFANMAASLIKHEQIVTTLAKAKELRRVVDKMITLGKKGGLSNYRLLLSSLRDETQTRKVFSVLAERYKDRQGGYTRVMKAGFRYGDAAPRAVIELVDRDPEAKGQDSGPTSIAAEKSDEDFIAQVEAAAKAQEDAEKSKKAEPKKTKAKQEEKKDDKKDAKKKASTSRKASEKKDASKKKTTAKKASSTSKKTTTKKKTDK